MARLLCEVGRESDAAEPFGKALDLEEEDTSVNNALAWFLATNPEPCLRDAARAVRLAKKVVAARPEAPTCRNTLGVAYYRSGDDRAAVAALEKAMALRRGGSSMDWFFLAMAHWRLGDRSEARHCFDRGVEWMDRHKAARRGPAPLSRSASDAGRTGRALAILLKTVCAPIHGAASDPDADLPGPSAANEG